MVAWEATRYEKAEENGPKRRPARPIATIQTDPIRVNTGWLGGCADGKRMGKYENGWENTKTDGKIRKRMGKHENG